MSKGNVQNLSLASLFGRRVRKQHDSKKTIVGVDPNFLIASRRKGPLDNHLFRTINARNSSMESPHVTQRGSVSLINQDDLNSIVSAIGADNSDIDIATQNVRDYGANVLTPLFGLVAAGGGTADVNTDPRLSLYDINGDDLVDHSELAAMQREVQNKLANLLGVGSARVNNYIRGVS